MDRAPLALWLMWFGPMGPTRRRSIDQIKRHAGVPVHLLTEDNFTDVGGDLPAIVKSDPLSKNHRADFLRAYVMHHYGGAYQDIKPTIINWRHHLQRLNGNSTLWFIGAEELPYFKLNPAWDRAFGNRGLLPPYAKVKSKSYRCVTSNGYYAAKPQTPLTRRWLSLARRKLSEHADQILKHPAPMPRCCTQYRLGGYPVYWTELHGDLLHPLQTVYCKRISTFGTVTVGRYRDSIEDTRLI